MREQLTTGQLRQLIANRRFRWINMVGRLKPGVPLRQADAAMKTIASALEKQFPTANEGRTLEMALESDAALGINQRSQFVLAGGVMMGVVGLVLLIACVTLANLLLAQSATREKEISIRSAMGAGRGRLVRQLLTESMLLSLVGGALGLLVAYWGRSALWSFRPPFLGNATIDLSFEPRVLLFTAGVSVLTGVLFGLTPAIRVSSTNLNEMLKSGGRSGAANVGTNRIRSLLVVSEIGLATVALIGAGLFVRSMQAAQKMDLGFDSAHIGFIALNPGQQHYDQAHGEQFYLDAMAGARAVPGVEAATVASAPPFGGGVLLTVFPEGEAQNPNYRGSLVQFNDVAPGYFRRAAHSAERRPRLHRVRSVRVEGRGHRESGAGQAALARPERAQQTVHHRAANHAVRGRRRGRDLGDQRGRRRSDADDLPPDSSRNTPRAWRCSCARRAIRHRWSVRCATRCRPSIAACRCEARARCRKTSKPGCGRRGWAPRCSASSAAWRCCWR